jgi:hypothetical protein
MSIQREAGVEAHLAEENFLLEEQILNVENFLIPSGNFKKTEDRIQNQS